METQTETAATRETLTERDRILAGLAAWIRQRPGLDFANYGDVTAYRSESRSITRDLHDAETLLAAVRWRSGIDADALKAAFRDAYSGRLSWDGERGALSYCTGQYWPTEYRRAACTVLASALWRYTRDHAMPPVSGFAVYCEDDAHRTGPATSKTFATHAEAKAYAATIARSRYPVVYELRQFNGAQLRAGDWLRRYFRREFGPRIARRWFD